MLTYNGLYPLAASLQSSRLDPRVALSDKIQGAFTAATQSYGGNFGWDIIFDPQSISLEPDRRSLQTAHRQYSLV